MKKLKLTDPFTGVAFDCIEDTDKSIVATHPLLHVPIKMRYDHETNCYYMPAMYFENIGTCTVKEAAEILDVTTQRVNALVKSGMLQAHELPNGSKVFLTDEVKRYNGSKRVGRPRKETRC